MFRKGSTDKTYTLTILTFSSLRFIHHKSHRSKFLELLHVYNIPVIAMKFIIYLQ